MPPERCTSENEFSQLTGEVADLKIPRNGVVGKHLSPPPRFGFLTGMPYKRAVGPFRAQLLAVRR